MTSKFEAGFSPEREVANEHVLHIEVDEVPDAEAFVREIRHLPIETQILNVSDFIKSKFKNAISPHNNELPPEEQENIRRVLRQEPKKLSEALCLEYGVCVEYHALGKLIFDKLGIPCKFQVGTIPGMGGGHTFLDIQVNGVWQIFDPFAEVFLHDIGKPELRLFDPEYYRTSETKK